MTDTNDEAHEALARLIVTDEVEKYGPSLAAGRILAAGWLSPEQVAQPVRTNEAVKPIPKDHEMNTPEFAVLDAAIVICTLDDSMYHHDRTDDMPCSTCLIVAQAAIETALPHLMTEKDAEIERLCRRIEDMADDETKGRLVIAPETLADWRETAGKATPGPWTHNVHTGPGDWTCKGVYETHQILPDNLAIAGTGTDGAFIATFDPPTVLALLDEVERLRNLQQAISECHKDPASAILRADKIAGEMIIESHNLRRERDAALAEVDRPRGVVAAVDDELVDSICGVIRRYWTDAAEAIENHDPIFEADYANQILELPAIRAALDKATA